MSDKEASGNESSDEYECQVNGCDYTGGSPPAVGSHFGHGHTDEEKREACLAELHRLADEIGRTPTQRDMNEYGNFSERAYLRLFGTWNRTLDAAGFDRNHNLDISREDILNEIRRLARELGRPPTGADMNDYGEYSCVTCSRRFQTWNSALKEAGIKPLHPKGIPKETLLDDLRRLAEKLGHTPSVADLNESGLYSLHPYVDQFDTWNVALQTAGLEPRVRKDIPHTDLLEELHRLFDVLDRTPRSKDMYQHGRFGVTIYREAFETWNLALEEAGIEPLSYKDWLPVGEDHWNWSGGYNRYYGPNWDEQREKRIEYDNCKCIICNMTRDEHYETYGHDFHVHHVQRKEGFRRDDGTLDYERANQVSNLRTFCEEHHWVWEGVPVAPIPIDD